MEAGSYSSEGHDFITQDELERLQRHSEAEIAQYLAAEARHFRSRLYEALAGHFEYDPSQYLFAVFADNDEYERDLEQPARKYTVISAKPSDFGSNDLSLPRFKLAQNEFVSENGRLYCLSEVVSISPREEARYELSGVLCDTETGESLEAVQSAMFVNPIQGKLFISPLRPGYVINRLVGEDGSETLPFGDGSSIEDSFYAYAKVMDWVSHVGNQVPIYTQIVS